MRIVCGAILGVWIGLSTRRQPPRLAMWRTKYGMILGNPLFCRGACEDAIFCGILSTFSVAAAQRAVNLWNELPVELLV